MDTETRDKIADAARRRGNCKRCGSPSIRFVDGASIGSFAGIIYKQCGGCGHEEVTKRKAVTRGE